MDLCKFVIQTWTCFAKWQDAENLRSSSQSITVANVDDKNSLRYLEKLTK